MMSPVIKTAVARAMRKIAVGAIVPPGPPAIAQPQDTSWLKWDATPTTPIAGTPGATPTPVTDPVATQPTPTTPAPAAIPVQTSIPPATGTGATTTSTATSSAVPPGTTASKPAANPFAAFGDKLKTMAQKAVPGLGVAENVVNKVKSMIPQGIKDTHTESVDRLKGVGAYQKEITAVTPEEFEATIHKPFIDSLASNDSTQWGAAMSKVALQAAAGGQNIPQAEALLSTGLQNINAKIAALPPEQQASAIEGFQNSLAVGMLPADPRVRESMKIMGVEPMRMLTDKATQETVKATKAYQSMIAQIGKEKTTVGGVWDLFKDNPMNFLIPAGLLVASLFEGKIPKLLGALAAAYGAYNLYGRYKALTDPNSPGAPVAAAGMEFEAGKAQTDPNAKFLADPAATQAAMRAKAASLGGTPEEQEARFARGWEQFKDTQALIVAGLGDRVAQRVLDTGSGIIKLVGGNPSALSSDKPTPAPTALSP